MAKPEGGTRAARAIRAALRTSGRSQTWLGVQVARIEGRGDPYSQAAVSAWIDRIAEQPPSRVFAIERALGMPPGTLSRTLGFLPVDLREDRTLTGAIDGDPDLNPQDKVVLRGLYELMLQRMPGD